VEVRSSDLRHLSPGEFLNDTVIDFKLKKLADELQAKEPELRARCHFFNTFFYKKLIQGTDKGSGSGGKKAQNAVDQARTPYPPPLPP
jgi:Ulp1 family protease